MQETYATYDKDGHVTGYLVKNPPRSAMDAIQHDYWQVNHFFDSHSNDILFGLVLIVIAFFAWGLADQRHRRLNPPPKPVDVPVPAPVVYATPITTPLPRSKYPKPLTSLEQTSKLLREMDKYGPPPGRY